MNRDCMEYNKKSCYYFVSNLLKLAFSLVDLSFEKETEQWRTYALTDPKAVSLYISSRAVDRHASTCTRTEDIGTASRYKETWWIVDLGGYYSIYSVDIQFSNYTGYGIIFCE